MAALFSFVSQTLTCFCPIISQRWAMKWAGPMTIPIMENQLSIVSIFVLIQIVILIKAWRRSKSNNTSFNLPPGPPKLPMIGNVHQFVGSLPHHRLTELAKKYGPIMHLQLGQISAVVITSSELVKEVTKTQDLIFASRPSNLASSVIFYNKSGIGFVPYGDCWREMRKICTLELFTRKRVLSFRSIRGEEVSSLITSIASKAGMPVNLSRMTTALSYCIISRTVFGKLQNQEESFNRIVQNIICAIGGFTLADLFPSVKLLEVVSGMRSKLEKLHEEVDAILEEIIKEHIERKKSNNAETESLVDILLNLEEHGMLEFLLTRQDVKAIILDIFVGGIETTSTVVEWTMSELVKQPGVLEKAQIEARRAFNGKERIDESSLHELPYLNSIIKESLRLHPPAPFIPRETQQRTEICGYEIPEKTQFLMNVGAIARDPYLWIEPERFYPERFLNSCIDYKGTNFEFLPFGSGRRMCPGMLSGISIVEIVLANLLYHFDWKIPNGVKPQDLDMEESFGISVGRKNDLCLIPIPFL